MEHPEDMATIATKADTIACVLDISLIMVTSYMIVFDDDMAVFGELNRKAPRPSLNAVPNPQYSLLAQCADILFPEPCPAFPSLHPSIVRANRGSGDHPPSPLARSDDLHGLQRQGLTLSKLKNEVGFPVPWAFVCVSWRTLVCRTGRLLGSRTPRQSITTGRDASQSVGISWILRAPWQR